MKLKDKLDIIELYQKNERMSNIISKYSVGRHTIYRILKEMGIKAKRKNKVYFINQIVKESICNKYKNNFIAVTELKDLFNIDIKSIMKILKDGGIKIRGKHTKEWLSESNIKDICDMYIVNNNLSIISKKYCISNRSIKNILIDNDIKLIKTVGKLGDSIIPNEYHKKIIDDYINNENSISLSKKYNVSYSSILNLLRNNNIDIRDKSHSNRKFNLDETYFEKIDTEDKAYFLGLLYADGCVSSNNSINITLQESEKGILETFILKLQYENKLKFRKRKFKNYQDCYRLSFSNKKMHEDLIKLGCIPRKSLILDLPSFDLVPETLFNHFIRGYFDGDGCIHISKEKERPQIVITSTKMFNDKFKKYIDIKLDISSFILERENAITALYICSKVKVLKTFIWMYRNCKQYFVKRKFEKFQDLLRKLDARINRINQRKLCLDRYGYTKEFFELLNEAKTLCQIILNNYHAPLEIKDCQTIANME